MRLAPFTILLCTGCGLALGLDDYRSSGAGGGSPASQASSTQAGTSTVSTGGSSASATTGAGGSGSPAGKPLGDSCEDPGECGSGHCVDGYCCESACDLPCDNNCSNAPGVCQPKPILETCGAYKCDGQNGTCPSSCTNHGECAFGHYCDEVVLQCLPQKPAGAACESGPECDSLTCDGFVCCQGLCNGVCRSCAQMETGMPDGTCAFVAAGLDPNDECGSGMHCNGSGSCIQGN